MHGVSPEINGSRELGHGCWLDTCVRLQWLKRLECKSGGHCVIEFQHNRGLCHLESVCVGTFSQ